MKAVTRYTVGFDSRAAVRYARRFCSNNCEMSYSNFIHFIPSLCFLCAEDCAYLDFVAPAFHWLQIPVQTGSPLERPAPRHFTSYCRSKTEIGLFRFTCGSCVVGGLAAKF